MSDKIETISRTLQVCTRGNYNQGNNCVEFNSWHERYVPAIHPEIFHISYLNYFLFLNIALIIHNILFISLVEMILTIGLILANPINAQPMLTLHWQLWLNIANLANIDLLLAIIESTLGKSW